MQGVDMSAVLVVKKPRDISLYTLSAFVEWLRPFSNDYCPLCDLVDESWLDILGQSCR